MQQSLIWFSLSHSLAPSFGTHKIPMSPHSILCETVLSWLLPWVLLQRIGMLIKACSLKLIRHWPGSFIKIDILPQHTPMGWSRTWEWAEFERESEKDRKKERESTKGKEIAKSTSQVAQLPSIEPLELRRGNRHTYLSFKGTLPL